MKFILRKASDIFNIEEIVEIENLADLQNIQKKYNNKLIIDFEHDWVVRQENITYHYPSIVIYDDHLE